MWSQLSLSSRLDVVAIAALGGALVVLAIAAAPRARAAWAWGLVALAVRLAIPAQVLMGQGYPVHRYEMATEPLVGNPLYGRAWGMWMAPWVAWGDGAGDAIHTVNAVLGSLTAVAVWALVNADEAAPAWTDHVAAAAVATLPLAATLSRTETMFVLAVALQAWALWGIVRDDDRGAWLGGLAAGATVWVRPGMAVAAALLLAMLALRGGRGPALVGAAAVAWRLLDTFVLQADPGDGLFARQAIHVLGLGKLEHLRWAALGGDGGHLLALDPWVLPLWIPLGVAAALAWRPTHRRSWLLLALALATALPALHLPHRTDIVRFQLSTAIWLAALAAHAPWPRTRVGLAALLAVALPTTFLARRPLGPPPTWTAEHHALREAAPRMSGTVWFHDGLHGDVRHARWASRRTGADWRPLDVSALAEGDLLWRGRNEALRGAAPLDVPCAVETLFARTVPAEGQSIEVYDADVVRLALERVVSCEAARRSADPPRTDAPPAADTAPPPAP